MSGTSGTDLDSGGMRCRCWSNPSGRSMASWPTAGSGGCSWRRSRSGGPPIHSRSASLLLSRGRPRMTGVPGNCGPARFSPSMKKQTRSDMLRRAFPIVLALAVLAGCNAGDGGRAVVEGAGAEEFVKLRAGSPRRRGSRATSPPTTCREPDRDLMLPAKRFKDDSAQLGRRMRWPSRIHRRSGRTRTSVRPNGGQIASSSRFHPPLPCGRGLRP
jgi:hypothetical protein